MPGMRKQKGAKKPRRVYKRRPKSAPAKAGLNKVEKKQVATIIAKKKELRYCPNWINYDAYDPTQETEFSQPLISGSTVLPNVYQAAFNTVSIVGLQTGHYLNSSSQQLDAALVAAGQPACMNPLGGYGMEAGDTAQNIDGSYAVSQSHKLNLQINALVASGNGGTVNDSVSPLCFRVIHVKCKQDQAGITPAVSGDLLRDMINNNAGMMSFMTQRQVMHDFVPNRDRFHVVNDIKFKLSEPVQPGYAGNSANQALRNLPYPTQKNLTLWLPKTTKKLRFSTQDNGVSNRYEPLNFDFVNYVFILCCREQVTNSEYSSTQKRWVVSTQGQSKYRDV